MQDSRKFIEQFSFIMHQYLQALAVIVPIFNYMVSEVECILLVPQLAFQFILENHSIFFFI